jgi:hypothetical protein
MGTSSPMQRLLLGLQIVASVAIALGLALPFIAIGQTRRSAYDLVRSANTLDVLDGPLRTALGLLVVCIPMLVGGVLLCVGLGWTRMGSALSQVIGLFGCGAGAISLKVSGSITFGPMVTLSSGLVVLGAALGRFAHQHRQQRGTSHGFIPAVGGTKH